MRKNDLSDEIYEIQSQLSVVVMALSDLRNGEPGSKEINGLYEILRGQIERLETVKEVIARGDKNNIC